jgi:hypothetical protein
MWGGRVPTLGRGSAASLLSCLLLACASKPQPPPAATPHATLPDAGVPTAKASESADPCTLVATLLAEPRPEFGGLSAIERPEAARAQQPDGKWLVALSDPAPPGAESPVDCGERLALTRWAAPPPAGVEPFALELSPEGSNAYHFTLIIGQRGPTPTSSEGRLERDEANEWRIAGTSGRTPRPLDAAPVERALDRPLPKGHAQAWLEFDTGKDTLSTSSLEAGLALTVRWGTRELRQVFASCADGAKGNALGELETGVLDLAGCGELYRLRQPDADSAEGRAGQRLVVEKQLSEGRWQPVISLPLPPEVQKISNPSSKKRGSHGG